MIPKSEPRLIVLCRVAGGLSFLFGAFSPSLFLPARINGVPALTIPQLAFSYVCLAAVFLGLLLMIGSLPAVYRARITFRDWLWVVFAFAIISCWWADHQLQQRKLDAANRQLFLRDQGIEDASAK